MDAHCFMPQWGPVGPPVLASVTKILTLRDALLGQGLPRRSLASVPLPCLLPRYLQQQATEVTVRICSAGYVQPDRQKVMEKGSSPRPPSQNSLVSELLVVVDHGQA